MNDLYLAIKPNLKEVSQLLQEKYDLVAKVSDLPGEIDFNYKVETAEGTFLLKISRPNTDLNYVQFQQDLIQHLSETSIPINCTRSIADKEGQKTSSFTDRNGQSRVLRLLTWTNGRLWSAVNPHSPKLLVSLGEEGGKLTKALEGFEHSFAHRSLEWDITQAAWTTDYLHFIAKEHRPIIAEFQKRFWDIQYTLKYFRQGIVHNDANDNNIIVSEDLINPNVVAIIDYGDAVHTAVINDLAIMIAYAVMGKVDPLRAACLLVEGYHQNYPLEDNELEVLHCLVAMRLVISVTKSAINKIKEPDNEYLQISENQAFDLLQKWHNINPKLAYYSFRAACGLCPHPNEENFSAWATSQNLSLKELFPSLSFKQVYLLDMSVSSTWLGNKSDYNDPVLGAFKLQVLAAQHPNSLLSGGYLETRPFYSTEAYRKESLNGYEYRTVHLGIDFWVDPLTPVHALWEGEVYSIFDNDNDKDYGPTLILKHQTEGGIPFFSLYGHLSKTSLKLLKVGQTVQKGDLIAFVGAANENGNWLPHLHFQLILDMLGNAHDFVGVAFPNELKVWKSICPDLNLFFKEKALEKSKNDYRQELLQYRKAHLGKSLSMSYAEPLEIVRGDGAYLIAADGRKYLDTVNNVAHVGHEHPRVVKAGQEQMALLNTNTRYLHPNINHFAKELLATFPAALSVVHFVNSGSEANELALRMAYAYTGQKDIIAMEVGYHGNTTGCIAVSSYKFDGKGGAGAPPNTHIIPLPDSFRGLYRGTNTGTKYAAHVQQQVEQIQAQGRNLAAFICESIISCGGQIELPTDYLSEAYAAVRKAGGLCIADEVQVGCGRVGAAYWGFQLHGVTPDIVTIGKPLGNGHPLAAVVCTRAVADAFANGMEYFNTFGGNPVSAAIGLEVLKVIKDEELQAHALEVGNYLKAALNNLQAFYPIIGDVRGQGLFLGFELVNEQLHPLGEKASYLANRMKELCILMSTDGKDNNVLKIKPPLVFTKENAEELIMRLTQVLEEDFMRLP